MEKSSKNRYLVPILVVILIIVGFSLFGRGGDKGLDTSGHSQIDENIHSVVVSDDGLVRLGISKSALPEGVELDAISIKESASFNTGAVIEDGLLAKVYSLEPAGLEFNEDIVIEVSLAGGDGEQGFAIPALIHQENVDGPIRLLPNQLAQLDAETNEVKVSSNIDHFSSAGFDFIFGSSMSPWVGEWVLDQSFDLSFDLWHFEKRIGHDHPEFGFFTGLELSDGSEYTISGASSNIDIARGFSPGSATLSNETLAKGERYSNVHSETCVEDGIAHPTLRPGIGINATVDVHRFSHVDKETGMGVINTETQDYDLFIESYSNGLFKCREVEFVLTPPPILCDPTGTIPELVDCPPE